VRSRLLVAVGTVGILMVASSLFAHHTWAVDNTRSVTVKGTVTGVDWSNPHVQIFVDTKDESGKIVKWTVGGPSPSRMAGTGWDKNTLKAGDVITAVGQRATDAPNLLKTQKVVLASGKEMVAYGGN
jgi:uncharacterized protein DUF6152